MSRVVFTMMSKKVGKKEITTFSEEGSFTEKRIVRARLGYITEFHRPEVFNYDSIGVHLDYEDGENLVEKMMRSLDWVVKNIDPLPDFVLKADIGEFFLKYELNFVLNETTL